MAIAFLGTDISSFRHNNMTSQGTNPDPNAVEPAAAGGPVDNTHMVLWDNNPQRVPTATDTHEDAVEWLTANGFYPSGGSIFNGSKGQWFTNV